MSIEEAVKYVAGAYGIILAVLFVVYALAARRMAVLGRELAILRAALARRSDVGRAGPEPPPGSDEEQ